MRFPKSGPPRREKNKTFKGEQTTAPWHGKGGKAVHRKKKKKKKKNIVNAAKDSVARERRKNIISRGGKK